MLDTVGLVVDSGKLWVFVEISGFLTNNAIYIIKLELTKTVARGSNNLSLDAKGRISIPTRHREDLLRLSEGQMVITISPNDRCLLLYTLAAWELVEQKLVSLPTLNPSVRKLKRMLIGHADDCEMDSNGRILLPAPLREFAMIQKKVVLVGQGDKYELWDEVQWNIHRESILTNELDESALPPELESLSF